jgi:hypothetical protein
VVQGFGVHELELKRAIRFQTPEILTLVFVTTIFSRFTLRQVTFYGMDCVHRYPSVVESPTVKTTIGSGTSLFIV